MTPSVSALVIAFFLAIGAATFLCLAVLVDGTFGVLTFLCALSAWRVLTRDYAS